MSCYTHLSIEERENLLVMLRLGKKAAEIARAVGRDKSTVSREIRRNSECKDSYSASDAQQRYEKRRKECVRREKLQERAYAETISSLLNRLWSPEQISQRLKKEKSRIQVSTSTIYRGLEKGLIDPSCRKKLRIKGKHRCAGRGKSKCGHLDIEYTIHDRPRSVEKRKQIGHWESDTIRGGKWSGCIASHAERKSRYVLLCKIPDRSAEEYTKATIAAFARLQPGKCKSLTTDHGKEFASHRQLSAALKCKVFFADPSSPWQRGTNENTNGLVRQVFPKRTSFAAVSQEDVDALADLLNKRPRKCLAWKSPFEVFFHRSLHLT